MIDQEIEMFSQKNVELANEITTKARQYLQENIELKAEIVELKKRLAELEILAVKTEGLRFKDLLFKCDIPRCDDDLIQHEMARDLRRAVSSGELPQDTIVSPGRYGYSPRVEQWLKQHAYSGYVHF